MRKISNLIARASLCLKKNVLTCCIAMVLLGFMPQAVAQNKIRDKTGFKIGDRMPDIVFTKVLNYKDSTAKLSDFKGKAILLDFWATWCGSCIKGFPHIDSIQKKYPKNLKVLMVNTSSRDTKAKVEDFLLLQKKQIPGFSIPLILGDSTLKSLFQFV